MNTKAVKSFGLALMLAAGVLAVLLALGTFSPQKAAATDRWLRRDAAAINPSAAAPRVRGISVRVNFGSCGPPRSYDRTTTLADRTSPNFGVPG